MKIQSLSMWCPCLMNENSVIERELHPAAQWKEYLYALNHFYWEWSGTKDSWLISCDLFVGSPLWQLKMIPLKCNQKYLYSQPATESGQK